MFIFPHILHLGATQQEQLPRTVGHFFKGWGRISELSCWLRFHGIGFGGPIFPAGCGCMGWDLAKSKRKKLSMTVFNTCIHIQYVYRTSLNRRPLGHWVWPRCLVDIIQSVDLYLLICLFTRHYMTSVSLKLISSMCMSVFSLKNWPHYSKTTLHCQR
jgi:hypothetical protein